MTGKQHVTIGAGLGFIGSYIYLGGDFSPKNITSIAVPIMIGSVIGSYMPDIDSTMAKARQVFNKILIAILIAIAGASYLDLEFINNIIDTSRNSILANTGMLFFIANVVLGRLSGHRLYTHRWIGTLSFCLSALMAFNLFTAVGFIIGYISHILADRTTKAGKHLNFFKFQLPMTNNKGKLHIAL